jgi:hypothetical protein
MNRTFIVAAAAAIAFAPVSVFTVGPAHAYPACDSTPAGPGRDACEQVCSRPGASGCGQYGAPTCNNGSANDCANRIARCAAGQGPCPY